MSLFDQLAIIIAKSVAFSSKFLHLGAGATWPGEIALRLRPRLLQTFSKLGPTIILVAGTNGKTTTVKMIETILKKNGKRVARNSSGANLDNGLASTFIAHTNWHGKLKVQYFIFEVDEATVPIILKYLTPYIVVLLNLFRDQLDRYGEVDVIAEKWLTACAPLSTVKFIINGDDPQLAYLGTQLKQVSYFGLNDHQLFISKMQHATDSIFCPKCGNRLTFGGVYFSHLGKYACGQCGFTHPDLALSAKDVTAPLEGVYNIYNTLAATLVTKIVGIASSDIADSLTTFAPAFGRMEQIKYQGKNVRILLSKNPTGCNESLRTVLDSSENGPVLFVLNDRIPDGTDVSWIWDVDVEQLAESKRTIVVSGDRCYDLALRLKYADVEKKYLAVFPILSDAIDHAVHATTEKETLWILATYSAMLEVRKIIVGRKIL